MQFAHPSFLWLFLLFIPLIAWYIWKQRNANATLSLSSTAAFDRLPRSPKEYLRYFLFVLRLATLACVIIILARPQVKDSWRVTSTEGTDIVIAMDVSSSMLARDFTPDRFGAAKEVAAKFIAGREADNIGIVIFAGESLTGVPMTVDRSQLLSYLQNLNMNMLEDGTAIGDGIATALNRLKECKAKIKIIILLTVGSNNTGVVSPRHRLGSSQGNGSENLHHRRRNKRRSPLPDTQFHHRRNRIHSAARSYRRSHTSDNSKQHRRKIFPRDRQQSAT